MTVSIVIVVIIVIVIIIDNNENNDIHVLNDSNEKMYSIRTITILRK